jgi:Tol biopolymer transport system component
MPDNARLRNVSPRRVAYTVLCLSILLSSAPVIKRAAAALSPKGAAASPASPQGGQSPFGGTPIALPGNVPAPNFDNGGEGVAYHDTSTGCTGDCSYRNTDVDLYGQVVIHNVAGEWLEYTVNVTAAGTYALVAEVSHDAAGGTFHVEFDGVDVTGPMVIPNTGGWNVPRTVTKTGISLTAGQKVMRVSIDANGTGSSEAGSLMSFRVVNTSAAQQPLNGTGMVIPGTIPVSDFDNGGELVAYHDNTAGCDGYCTHRNTDVDMWERVVFKTTPGEWLEYTVNVSATNTYSINARVGSGGPGGTFHIEMDGVDVTGPMTVPDTGNWSAFQTVSKPGVTLTAGQHVMRLAIDSGGYDAGSFSSINISGQSPYSGVPIALPGTVPASDFDNGGELVAYHDNTPGCGGDCTYRNTDVDLYGQVNYQTSAGEWLEYTVDVSTAGTYTLAADVGSDFPGGTFHVEFDGVDVTGPMVIPNTGGWHVFQTITKTGISLTGGQKVMRVYIDANGPGSGQAGSLNAFRLLNTSTPQSPLSGLPISLPGTIPASDFDNGGDTVAYHDSTIGCTGYCTYRNTDVDMWERYVIHTTAGEWLEYTANVATAGTYTLTARVGSDAGGGTFHVEVDGVNVTGPMTMPSTGNWSAFQTVTKTGISLTAGQKVIRLAVDSNPSGAAEVGTFDTLALNLAGGAPLPSNGRIAFNSYRDGGYEIFTMNADGTDQTRVTIAAGDDTQPSWSPDGSKIAFQSNRDGNDEIYTMFADGYGLTRLTDDTAIDGSPAWSPDGSKIAYMSLASGAPNIWVMNADGSNKTKLTTANQWVYDPAWSPDGSKIVFASENFGSNDIFVMNANGTGLTNLTPSTPFSRDTSPAFSPDGTKIVFVSTRHGNSSANTQIYRMNADGSNVVRVTNGTDYDDKPAYSPDGTKIAFQSLRSANLDIYTMNADGMAQTRLTDAVAQDQYPDWQVQTFAPTPTATPTPTPGPAPSPTPGAGSTRVADVVAFDQVFFYNRLGALNPAGMIYALRRDVVPINASQGLVPGNVRLRDGKRPRPIVLRMNVGDKLEVHFQNLLSTSPIDEDQPHTRTAGVHVVGLQLVGSIASDGSNVGANTSSLVAPGGSAVYTFYAEREANHLLYSTAATTGGEGDGGSLAMGLFGSVNVEPKNAEWYRSQVTRQELAYATTGHTADGHPIVNYNAVYPAGHPRAGQPVLNIRQGNEIVHSDLNAVITGPEHGRFPPGTYRPNATEPDRDQPFREFTVVYHDEIKAVQAFPQFFEDPVLSHTLHGVRDGFAINYGTGGLGAEILANRLGVGPMRDCPECLYEEFFLTAWAVGDPAMIVDVPANATNSEGGLRLGPKATKAFFPDDPSNVHHSYINDHVKFRIVHAGPKEHHIHHLHAHQWLHTPDDDNSTYLDSQALGPGYSFTTEITHNGGGNRNKVVGDSIFHCHFYPHFAQGMWELWRTHDVFEEGTALDGTGRPAPGSRALPDGEIQAGTPIPALVPLPTLAMAPMPEAQVQIVNGQPQITGGGNPGYPFFVPGVAGHRPPHPPLDTVDDGGLPRHIIVGGTFVEQHNRLDFDKRLLTADAREVPETGTPTERAAMNYHAVRNHPTFKPDGTTGNFVLNGLPPKPGAPYADPCIDDAGNPIGSPRLYKAANIQLDVKFNKAGWHFPQQRIETLWDDVEPTRAGTRPPEPFFFRGNTNDCITFYQTNLVPRTYQLDDFQVKTPTDVMGQHIHLVKFDVTSSDGSGNGWNYEDGTFSPEEVVERIDAINAFGGFRLFNGGARVTLAPEPHPFFHTLGAQTTVQRWYADNVLNNAGQDRTLRTVFTHDHFGPSTHQQIGMYAGLVIEPQGSTWRHPENGQIFGGRFDGGPTSWRADILTPNSNDSYREFLLEFGDFQLAYKAGGGVDGAGNPVPDPPNAINPPAKDEPGLPFLLEPAPVCPGGVPLPCPEAISAADPGTMVVNYRNEPVPLRIVNDPNAANPQQAAGDAGDLANVYRSDVTRAFAPMNTQPGFYPPLTGGIFPKDPFTPLLRAYEDDRVQIRILVGAHEEGHNFGVHGVKWKFEPSSDRSGYRNNQMMGISEHYEFVLPTLPKSSIGAFADYLYAPGFSVDDQWNGLWGIMRAYNRTQPDLLPLPNNSDGHGPVITNVGDFNGVCPKTAPPKNFFVSAVSAQNALPNGTLVYNPRTNLGGKLHDPTAILFVRSDDLNANGTLKAGVPVEPLFMRANAGDCINVTLNNRLPAEPPDLPGFNTMPMIVNHFNANQVRPSNQVGLHPQLVFFDVTRSNGVNVGFNKVQTATPGHSVTYQWYAGDMRVRSDGFGVSTPIEFGASNLSSADPIKHSNKGAVGGLIIEPQGATVVEDTNMRAAATVTTSAGTFREFGLLFQTDVNLRFGERYDELGRPRAVPNLAEAEDPEDSGQKAFNYRTEPLWKRMGFEPDTPLEQTRNVDFTNSLSNAQVGGDPVTPVFTAAAGTPVRFRIFMPGGHSRNSVFNLHGHIWEEEPYLPGSLMFGPNPLSEWKGAQYGIGAGSHFDFLLKNGAGGRFAVPGDYLYRNQSSFLFDGGMWGIFRVQ